MKNGWKKVVVLCPFKDSRVDISSIDAGGHPHTHTHTTPYYYLVSFLFDCGSAADVCFCARFESTRECLRFCPFFHARLDSTRRGGECVGEAKKHTTSSSLMLIQVGLINTYETGSPLRDGNKAKRAVLKTGRRNRRRRTAGRQSVWPVANKTAKVSLSLSWAKRSSLVIDPIGWAMEGGQVVTNELTRHTDTPCGFLPVQSGCCCMCPVLFSFRHILFYYFLFFKFSPAPDWTDLDRVNHEALPSSPFSPGNGLDLAALTAASRYSRNVWLSWLPGVHSIYPATIPPKSKWQR